MLWIALHLPLLSLESFEATLLCAADQNAEGSIEEGIEGGAENGERPLALADTHHILSANACARALGIRRGLKRATALALSPRLQLGQADPARDAQALIAIAHAALAFTPNVVIPPADEPGASPHTVLLEVQGSLRYFGGLQVGGPRDSPSIPASGLLPRLLAAIAPFGHRVHTVAAPTPQGAALLARVHRQHRCADMPALHAALDAAPVWLLGPGREHWEALQGMGLRTIADLRSLPRAGLSRRFGQSLLGELDRALGDAPDPRVPIVLPPSFESRLELFARADTTEQLLFASNMLLARLVAWLSAQHAFVRRFSLVMQHEKRWRSDAGTPPATVLEIALAEPSRDAAHLLVLLRERLGQVQLPAPTLELRLLADDIARQPPPNQELFPTPRGEKEGLTRLIERLQARLGPHRIQRMAAVADHRPECASTVRTVSMAEAGPALASRSTSSPASASASASASGSAASVFAPAPTRVPREAPAIAQDPDHPPAVRPVWMLEPHQPLAEKASGPVLDGRPLRLLSGPERIEAGWWEEAGLAERDYFIAQVESGALVWIYRARLPLSSQAPGWFLQGRFG
ncbi:DNA polymerase Y family protein [soil metagenome]